jgi:hypothetical protein
MTVGCHPFTALIALFIVLGKQAIRVPMIEPTFFAVNGILPLFIFTVPMHVSKTLGRPCQGNLIGDKV